MKRNFTSDNYLHITNRGFHGIPVVKDDRDKEHFIWTLRYLNDTAYHKYWIQKARAADAQGHDLPWPKEWGKQEPLVRIFAYTLMPNHFHLLLQPATENGVSRFVKSISDSRSKRYNNKYDQKGGLWESSYNASVVDSDQHLRFLFGYIQVKNVFELYPDGFAAACENFDEALQWAKQYQFSSLADQLGETDQSDVLSQKESPVEFENIEDFKQVAKDSLRYSQAKKLPNTDIHLE